MSNDTPPSPACTVAKAQQDDLVVTHLPLAYRLAREERQLRGGSIDDLRQEASLALVECVGRYDPARGTFATFAMTAVKFHFNKLARKKEVPVQPLVSDPSVQPQTSPTGVDEQEQLAAAIAALPPRERQVMQLRLGGQKHREIAATMGLNVRQVARLVRLAKDRIGTSLGVQPQRRKRRPAVEQVEEQPVEPPAGNRRRRKKKVATRTAAVGTGQLPPMDENPAIQSLCRFLLAGAARKLRQ